METFKFLGTTNLLTDSQVRDQNQLHTQKGSAKDILSAASTEIWFEPVLHRSHQILPVHTDHLVQSSCKPG